MVMAGGRWQTGDGRAGKGTRNADRQKGERRIEGIRMRRAVGVIVALRDRRLSLTGSGPVRVGRRLQTTLVAS
jgi:hypothetical protein